MNKITRFYKLANKFYQKNFTIIAILIKRYMRIVYSCEIPYTCKIADSVVFAHNGLGCVINSSTEIGEGTIIYQNVTIGNRNSSRGPIIGKNVLIGAGAIVIGDIIVGDNSKIGAGSIITKDVPIGAIMVNDSAKMIKLLIEGE